MTTEELHQFRNRRMPNGTSESLHHWRVAVWEGEPEREPSTRYVDDPSRETATNLNGVKLNRVKICGFG